MPLRHYLVGAEHGESVDEVEGALDGLDRLPVGQVVGELDGLVVGDGGPLVGLLRQAVGARQNSGWRQSGFTNIKSLSFKQARSALTFKCRHTLACGFRDVVAVNNIQYFQTWNPHKFPKLIQNQNQKKKRQVGHELYKRRI